jgi:hypothetical protein
MSVYFNIRNTLPKFCPFLLGHSVYNEEEKYTENFGRQKREGSLET